LADISFTLPSPYQSEQADIARRQKMAEIMQQQAFQPAETFSYGGIQARTSPLTSIAKALQGYVAGKTQRDLIGEQKALGERAQRESASDFATLFGHMQGQEAKPVRPPATAIDDQGNFNEMLPAVPARAPGTVDPSILAALRDPQAKQLAMSQLLAQMRPQAPIAVKEGETLFDTRTGKTIFNQPKADKIKETKILNENGVPTLFGITESGERKNLGPAQQVVSPDTSARLAQEKTLADRTFNSLSAAQQQQARQEAQRLGISLEDLKLRQYQAQNPAMSFQETEGGAMAFNPRTGAAVPVIGPDGKPLQGGRPLTESQGKATTFANRAAEADQILNTVGQGGKVQPGLLKRVGESIPFVGEGLGTMLNVTQSSEQRRVEQAQRNFVNAILRQESGASISPSEFASAQKQYFPQPGEDAETIAQKAANRRTAIAGMAVQAGPGMQRMQQIRQQTQQPMRAKNPSTGQEIISTDGGQTWQPVQGAQ
jgi:hypothetical protein